MQVHPQYLDTRRYAKCIEVSKRVRWDIERDVIWPSGRGRAPTSPPRECCSAPATEIERHR